MSRPCGSLLSSIVLFELLTLFSECWKMHEALFISHKNAESKLTLNKHFSCWFPEWLAALPIYAPEGREIQCGIKSFLNKLLSLRNVPR